MFVASEVYGVFKEEYEQINPNVNCEQHFQMLKVNNENV